MRLFTIADYVESLASLSGKQSHDRMIPDSGGVYGTIICGALGGLGTG